MLSQVVSDLWLRHHCVALLFGLELLSQAKAVLHLVLAVLVEGAWAFKDFLEPLIVVMFGVRFVNGGDDVV